MSTAERSTAIAGTTEAQDAKLEYQGTPTTASGNGVLTV